MRFEQGTTEYGEHPTHIQRLRFVVFKKLTGQSLRPPACFLRGSKPFKAATSFFTSKRYRWLDAFVLSCLDFSTEQKH